MSLNRSVIGQMNALGHENEIELYDTVAPRNREKGSGEIAGTVDITLTPLTQPNEENDNYEISSVSNSTTTRTPSRRQAPVAFGDSRRHPRPRRMNINFGAVNNPSLPPSTGQHGKFNIQHLIEGYTHMSEGLVSLTKDTHTCQKD